MADGSVLFGWISGGHVRDEFLESFAATILHDAVGDRKIVGYLRNRSGVNVSHPRCQIAQDFLDHPDQPDWLFMVDTDMSWTPDQFEALYQIADAKDRPIVGGLCVGCEEWAPGTLETFLTLYTVHEDRGPIRWNLVPDQPLAKVHATGAAFLLVHRSVFQALRAKYQGPFWAFRELEIGDHPTGEDVAFCIRAAACGYPTHVATTIRPGHHKGPLTLNVDYHQRTMRESKTLVVVPVKDRLDLTSRMLNQLKTQGGWDDLIVFDNGSKRETRNWLTSQHWFTTYDAAGASIHDMWNAGLDHAAKLHPRTNIIILNNDLELGPNFCHGLVTALRANPDYWAVSPNYDQRTGPDLIPVQGICAGRYDGTGGLAGFAFCLRGEWVRASEYRFPTEARWWYGDTDLALTITQRGGQLGIVRDTTVTHIDGGSQTARPADWDEQIEKDAAWFHGKWAQQREQVPGPRRTGGLLTHTPDGRYAKAQP